MRLLELCIGVMLASCAVEPDVIDERDAEFSSVVISGEEHAVLELVNTAATSVLDDDVPLDARAAANIVAHRDGADGIHGTADDDPFDDLAELDAIPYVGPRSLEKIVEFVSSSAN